MSHPHRPGEASRPFAYLVLAICAISLALSAYVVWELLGFLAEDAWSTIEPHHALLSVSAALLCAGALWRSVVQGRTALRVVRKRGDTLDKKSRIALLPNATHIKAHYGLRNQGGWLLAASCVALGAAGLALFGSTVGIWDLETIALWLVAVVAGGFALLQLYKLITPWLARRPSVAPFLTVDPQQPNVGESARLHIHFPGRIDEGSLRLHIVRVARKNRERVGMCGGAYYEAVPTRTTLHTDLAHRSSPENAAAVFTLNIPADTFDAPTEIATLHSTLWHVQIAPPHGIFPYSFPLTVKGTARAPNSAEWR